MKLFPTLLKITPPGSPTVPSFSQASRPDYTIYVAGLRISAHSDAAPWVTQYLTVQREHDAPVSAVPEVGTGVMLTLGVVVLWMVRRGVVLRGADGRGVSCDWSKEQR